jgi:hypothetical protein|tara:strand:+ start:230 stop:1438 length:1209 start_codon:yes stop_codon:yes gene_type:complete
MTSIFILLLVTVAGVNLVFAPCTVAAYDVSKIVWVSILVAVMLIVWCVQVLNTNRFCGFSKTKTLNLGLLAYIGIVIISIVFSDDWVVNFVGFYKRQAGFISLIVYISLFIISANFINRRNAQVLISTLVWAALAACIYGLIQTFGLDSLTKVEGRIFSAFGNCVFYSAFLAMAMPCMYYKIFKAETLAWRIAYGFILAVLIINMSNTQVRSGLIAAFVSSVIFFYFSKRIKNVLIASVVGAGVIALGFAILHLQGINFIERIFCYTNYDDRIRIIVALPEVIKNNFFTGVGSGGLRHILVYKPHIIDNTHNVLTQQLISYGVFGFGVYIYLIKCFCCDVWKSYKREHDKLLITTLFAGCVSFFIFLQFNPSHTAITATFCVLSGAIYGIKNNSEYGDILSF